MKKTFISLLLVLMINSCSKNEKPDNTVESIPKFKSNNGNITLIDPVARPAAKGMNSAVFVKIKNTSDYEDTLYAAESDIAELVEIHETYKVNEDKMGMRHVEFVIIPPRSEVLLKPRSFHVMLIDLNIDMPVSNTVNVELLFRQAGAIDIKATVKDVLINSK